MPLRMPRGSPRAPAFGAHGLEQGAPAIVVPPPAVTVRAATKVIHDNDGGILFAVSDATFRSEALDSGDTYAFTSPKAGAFACSRDLYPQEQGRIAASR